MVLNLTIYIIFTIMKEQQYILYYIDSEMNLQVFNNYIRYYIIERERERQRAKSLEKLLVCIRL